MMKKTFICLAFAILSTICLWMGIPQELYAQNIIDGTYLPPEPQSTGMLQYGGQQPALYTGAVSAEIPVYVYTDPDFTIPISLTYSYSGYMPGIPANYVGLGWSLNAGGCISRRVRGVKDECDLGNVLGYKVASDRRDWSDLSNLQDIITKDGMPTIHSGHDYYETTSDIYMYSFLGHSGKFVIDRRGIATVYDSSDPHGIISVDLSQLCHQRFQSKISIETGDGYRYEFGGHLTQSAQDDNIDCAVTYTPASPMGTYDRNSDEWYLTKIVAPNGRVATFTYRLGEGCMTKSVMPTANNKTFFTYTGTSTGFPFHFDGGESISSGISNSYGYLITEKSIAQLETVSITGGGAMTFSYESRLPERGKPNTALPVNLVQPDRLKSIVVSDASSNILASTILSYKYTSQANSANPVLLLSAIQNLDGEYKLSYYNESAAFPLQGSPAIDHWGYWNANSDEDISSVLPEASLDNQYRETITGTSRNPSSAKAISGMLRKIEYPTGGWTLFEYEPNRYRKEIVRNSTPQSQGVPVLNSLSSIKTGAGMRLKALEDYSSQNQSYRTEYIYEDATGLCSGIMLNMPRYYKAYKTEGASTNGLTVILSSNNQGCEIDGVNVEYSHVQVIHADGSKTMNSFSTYEDYPDSVEWIGSESMSTPGSPVSVTFPAYANNIFRQSQSKSMLRGKPKSVTVWDADGIKRQEESYLYDDLNISERYILDVAYAADSSYVNKTYTGFVPLTRKLKADYYNGYAAGFSVQEQYSYNSKGQLVLQSTMNGSGTKGSRVYYRYLNGRLAGCRTRSVGTTVINGNEYVVSSDSLLYASSHNNPSPISVINYCITSPVRVHSGMNIFRLGAGDRFRRTDIVYTQTGMRVSRVNNPGGAYTEYLWNGSKTQVTRVNRNTYQNGWQYEWKGFVGVSKSTDPSGVQMTYQYDDANRLECVKDIYGNKVKEYRYNLVSTSVSTTGADSFNSIRQSTYISSGGVSKVDDISYYDGLGYPLLDVSFGGGGNGRNLVTRHEIDPMRRIDAKALLPAGITTSDDETFMTPRYMDEPTICNWYMLNYNDSRPFIQKEYETSPVGKVSSIQNAGDIYQSAGKKTMISRRIADPQQDEVWGIVPDFSSNNLDFNVFAYYWIPGDLLCECSVDEDGRKTEVFTDRFGKKILERSWNGQDRLDTYYVYDLKDRLVLVLQPEGSKDAYMYSAASFDASSDIAKKYCFLYIYDGDGTLIRRRQPGCGWEDYVYDSRQRKRYFTDERLLENNLWIRYNYDSLDREVSTQLVKNTSGVTASSVRSAYLVGAGGTADNTFTVVETLHECKYWGETGYTSLAAGGFPSSSFPGAVYRLGLLAMETVREMPSLDGACAGANPKTVVRRYSYDYMCRSLYQKEYYDDDTILIRSLTYDFSGNVLSKREQIGTDEGELTLENKEEWTYDSRGRAMTYIHNYGGTPKTAITYAYDDLGRLISKSYDGGKATESFSWNLQGWQTGCSAKWGNTEIFSESLKYYDPTNSATAAQYAGNISETLSKQEGRNQVTMSYSYDGAGRLLSAARSVESSVLGTETYTYDMNGNVASLTRPSGLVTELRIFHSAGNCLSSMRVSRRMGNLHPIHITRSYSHDSRGNMTMDGDKNLLISYNLCNLPCEVMKVDSTDSAKFIYLADGTKYMTASGSGDLLKYKGLFIFNGDAVQSVSWQGGVYIMENDTDSWSDHLYVKDHLGNVRSIVAISNPGMSPASDVIVSKSDYLPYGTRVEDLSASSLTEVFINQDGMGIDRHRWHLGSKEEIPEGGLNLLDFGARYYNPAICRWTSIDPMAEKCYYLSPYVYCLSCPVNGYDIDGNVDWRLVMKGAGVTSLGAAGVCGIGIALAGTGGGAAPFLAATTIEVASTIGLGMSLMLTGFMVDPSEKTTQLLEDYPVSASNLMGKTADFIAGNENNEIETVVGICTFFITATPTGVPRNWGDAIVATSQIGVVCNFSLTHFMGMKSLVYSIPYIDSKEDEDVDSDNGDTSEDNHNSSSVPFVSYIEPFLWTPKQ